ncbi:MAG: hypothetical protein IPJ65_38385 [Archangiaceae bacterium]|nr:hypothetical protein [Archangiaceae bacterium]
MADGPAPVLEAALGADPAEGALLLAGLRGADAVRKPAVVDRLVKLALDEKLDPSADGLWPPDPGPAAMTVTRGWRPPLGRERSGGSGASCLHAAGKRRLAWRCRWWPT